MKSKILLIGPCLAMGGMERAAVNTANGLNNDTEVIFVSLFKKPHFFKLDQGIHLEEPDNFNILNLSIFKTIKWLRHLVKVHKPDRVLVFNKFYAALTALALIGLSVPFYISERSSPFFVWKQPFRFINRLAFSLRPPLGVMAQTSIAAEYQKKYYSKSTVKVIPNVLREIVYHPEIKRENIILAVGRLGDYLKGFDLLIESFSLLQNKDWELHIVGGDEDGADLKELAANLGIIERIKFLGKIQDTDKYYAQAGIFVIPSRSEGFPNALVEAMANGCACVAFDFTAGPKDIIDDGVSGIIVENGNVIKLAQAIDYLIENPEKRIQLGESARIIKERLDQKVIINKILEFLDLKQ